MTTMKEQLVALGFPAPAEEQTKQTQHSRDERIHALINPEGLRALYEEMYLPLVIKRIDGDDPRVWGIVWWCGTEEMHAAAFEDAYPMWEDVL